MVLNSKEPKICQWY